MINLDCFRVVTMKASKPARKGDTVVLDMRRKDGTVRPWTRRCKGAPIGTVLDELADGSIDVRLWPIR